MILYIVVVSCLLALYLYQYLGGKQRVPKGLKRIPIEKGLPIIGIVTHIEKPFCSHLVKLSQKHGPIYGIKIGMREIVVLNNYEYIKAALVDNGEVFSGRWKTFKYVFVTNDAGIIFIDGNVWAKQRSFALKTLKDFGVGRSRSMEIVQDECVCMLENLTKLEGKSVDFARFIPIYTANVILKFVMNRRFTHGDPDYEIIEKYMVITSTSNDPIANFSLMFPFLEKNEWLMKFAMWITSRKSIIDKSHDVFKKEIEEHRNKTDFNSGGDNFMDRFLIKQSQMMKESGDVETFTDWQLVRNGLELITAGYDTTSSLLVWGLMLMGMYLDVQDKVYEEIIDKIGTEKMPSSADKVSLNFTRAVMDEILRLSSIAPLSVYHRTLKDINLNGYFIPKDTVVIPNILACHLDHNTWEKPLEFYPEHFLSITENGVYKYKPREEVITFSMGKRQCLGEALARMEYYIFLTSILQRFQVSLVNKNVKFDVFRSNEGLIRLPDIRDFIFERRK